MMAAPSEFQSALPEIPSPVQGSLPVEAKSSTTIEKGETLNEQSGLRKSNRLSSQSSFVEIGSWQAKK